MPVLLHDAAGGVATITLHRPEVRNALSSELLVALREAMAMAEADDDVGVVVLTGSDPAFCAGLDLRELGSTGANLTAAGPGSSPWAPLTKPLVAAVNGVAVTGGLELVLNCDVVVASDRAGFRDTHARVGLMPGWGMTVHLPRRVGLARALEMTLTAEPVDAATAAAWGLVDHVVPHDELMPAALAIAQRILGNDQAAVRNLLASYRRVAAAGGVDAGLRVEAETRDRWNTGVRPADVAARRGDLLPGR